MEKTHRELRTILQAIRQLVENKWREVEREDLKWQAVSSFVFLRFFVPAILNPHLFQITAGELSSVCLNERSTHQENLR
jgi:hypothetical protein